MFHSSLRVLIPCALLAWRARGSGGALPVLPSLASSGGSLAVNLTVLAARLSSGSDFALSTRAYAWARAQAQGGASSGGPALSGPTLRVRPGDTLTIVLANALGDDFGADAAWPMNAYRYFNTTNMHTHGLHVSPLQDDVFSTVSPGETLTYTYSIPVDHPPGALWYHAHWHGATMIQVMGGLVGALIIDPSPATPLPPWLSALPEFVLVLQNFVFVPLPTPPGGHATASFSQLEATCYNATSGAGYAANAVYDAAAATTYFTVNGLVAPVQSLTAGDSYVFRLVYAAAMELPTVSLQGGINASCSMQVIALDGVYLTAPRAVTFVRLPPGARADVVIACAQAGAVNLSATATNFSNLAQTLVALTVTGGAAAPVPLPAAIAVARPPYLTDLLSVTPATLTQMSLLTEAPFPTGAQGILFWLGLGTNCSGVGSGAVAVAANVSGCAAGPFAGSRGLDAAAYPAGAVLTLGAPAQATLYSPGLGAGSLSPHPMHIHVNHFQIISIGSGLAGDGFSVVGDWRDTVMVGTGAGFSSDAGTVIRWWPANFTGEVVVHCHYLTHEDRGMMTTLLVATPAPAPQPTAGLSTSQRLGLGLGIGLSLAATIATALACAKFMAAQGREKIAGSPARDAAGSPTAASL